MFLVLPAIAATLPSGPPTLVDGTEVAPYRASRAAPALLAAVDALAEVPGNYGDEACPSADGSACAVNGVSWSGTLSVGPRDSFADCADEYSSWPWVAAVDLEVGLVADAWLSVDGNAGPYSYDGEEDDQGEVEWEGAFAVTGAFGGLEDDAIEGSVGITMSRPSGEPRRVFWSWSATNLGYGWEATELYLCDAVGVRGQGRVEVDTHTVRWEFVLTREADALHLSQAGLELDGVRTGTGSALISVDFVDHADEDGDGFTARYECDDHAAATFPGAEDACGDGIDQDCDGYDDGDCDGYSAEDCDDDDPAVHEGAVEICGDGIDQDCDGYDDRDCDGYDAEDCDDDDAAVHREADEVCADGVDQDCDGHDDADCDGYDAGDCDDADPDVHPGATEYDCDLDLDCDGHPPGTCDEDRDGARSDEDCDDHDPARAPGLRDICGDGIDQDCSNWDCGPGDGCYNGFACGRFSAIVLLGLPVAGLRRRHRSGIAAGHARS